MTSKRTALPNMTVHGGGTLTLHDERNLHMQRSTNAAKAIEAISALISALPEADAREVLSAFSAIHAESSPRSRPTIGQTILAASNDGTTENQKIISRTLARFGDVLHASGRVDITKLDSSPAFKRLPDVNQRIEVKANLKARGLLVGYDELASEA
jgi:lipopolysaccharide biosynthesis protein